jgi:transcriptional regulator
VTIVDDVDGKLDLLLHQLEAYEPGSGAADPAAHERRLPGIRAARLDISDVAAKFKYGGNVDAAHRHAVAERLAERASLPDDAARQHLLRRITR